jgi:hypothetical protein
MRYQEIRPTQSLPRFVECFWILEAKGDVGAAQPERILPDGCVELILNLSAPFQEFKPQGEKNLQRWFRADKQCEMRFSILC